MVGIPQRLALQQIESPGCEKLLPANASRLFYLYVSRSRIRLAQSADSTVAQKYLVAKIAGVGAKAPFVYAPIRAKGKTPRRDFETAPTAKRAAILAFLEVGWLDGSAGHGARGAHKKTLRQFEHKLFDTLRLTIKNGPRQECKIAHPSHRLGSHFNIPIFAGT